MSSLQPSEQAGLPGTHTNPVLFSVDDWSRLNTQHSSAGLVHWPAHTGPNTHTHTHTHTPDTHTHTHTHTDRQTDRHSRTHMGTQTNTEHTRTP